MFRRLPFLLLWLALVLPAFAQNQAGTIRRSLVRISTTSQDANYSIPWTPGNLGGGSGSGFVIEGQRILTNAHVVSNAKFLTVEREADPKKYVATLEHVAHDCDLAVLKVADPHFFEGTSPLGLGGIPEVDSVVSVFGYPIGGERLSVTRGVISRIDFQTYSHSSADAHLVIQIDAAINPGNSGGPVLQEGKVVGVAFQGYSGDVAQSTGYMIPVPVIQRFLTDIQDGKYDRYMDLSLSTFNLQNPAQRRALGLADDDRGVLVGTVQSAGSAAGVLKEGDVLLTIDGRNIGSDGFVELDGERVQMAEVVERKFKGDTVKFTIIRDGQQQETVVTLDRAWPFTLQSRAYGVEPRFILRGGLLFQPVTSDMLDTHGIEDLRVRYHYDFFISDEVYKKHPELIVISSILPDPINAHLGAFIYGIVEKVNGEPIKTLDDLAAAFAADVEQYVIELVGEGRPVVLERKAVEESRERIHSRYNVLKDQNLSNDAS